MPHTCNLESDDVQRVFNDVLIVFQNNFQNTRYYNIIIRCSSKLSPSFLSLYEAQSHYILSCWFYFLLHLKLCTALLNLKIQWTNILFLHRISLSYIFIFNISLWFIYLVFIYLWIGLLSIFAIYSIFF